MLSLNCSVIRLFVREVEVQYLECTYMDSGNGANAGHFNINALNFFESVSSGLHYLFSQSQVRVVSKPQASSVSSLLHAHPILPFPLPSISAVVAQ